MKIRSNSDQIPVTGHVGDVLLQETPGAVRDQNLVRARILTHLMTAQLQCAAAYLFTRHDLDADAGPRTHGAAIHDDILRAQALRLSSHVAALHDVLCIEDIYAHPLIRRRDILTGHRLRAFAGAPLRDQGHRLIGVMCAVDVVERRWSDRDIRIMRRIVAQFTARRLSQS